MNSFGVLWLVQTAYVSVTYDVDLFQRRAAAGTSG